MSRAPKAASALLGKLLARRDLGESERQQLAARPVPISALAEVAAEALREGRWFPEPAADQQSVWAGIERRRLGYAVHRRFEVGILRYADVRPKRVLRIGRAVSLYIEHYQQLEPPGDGALRLSGIVIDPAR